MAKNRLRISKKRKRVVGNPERIMKIMGFLERGEVFFPRLDIRESESKDFFNALNQRYKDFAFGTDQEGDVYHRYRRGKREYLIVHQVGDIKIERNL